MPSEEKFHAYEVIALQISEEGMKNVKIPDNTQVTVSQNEITIDNTLSYYSVTAKLTETNIKFEREDGSGERLFEKIIFGGGIIGFLIIGAIGGLIIYNLIRLLIYIKSSLRKIIFEFRDNYDRRKKELENINS